MTEKAVSLEAHERNLTATSADGVKCELDGVWVHSIPAYLKFLYPDMTTETYQKQFHGSPLFSPSIEETRKRAQAPVSVVAAMASTVVKLHPEPTMKKEVFSAVFGLGDAKAAKNARGEPIMIDVLSDCGPELNAYIPDVDPNYIFPIDSLKSVMMAAALNLPFLAWGMHGTGKTSLIEQFCARTKRPAIRAQHTISTEEAHIVGQFTLQNGHTVYQPGPLAHAMREGLCYIADEYDFALPSVLSVYQAALEGKPLVIKDAPPEWRIVRPHPNFRFFATGNTNGGGDDTGLYQGTQLQNAAMYSRFGITVEITYMPEAQEIGVVASQGKIHEGDAKKLVGVARMVREAYGRGDIGMPVSPRELIRAAMLGRALGGEWKQGLALAYTNRLNPVDRNAVLEIVQRLLSA